MTSPTTFSVISDRIFLGQEAELLALSRYSEQIETRGYLPLNLLEECALHLRDEGHAHFSLPHGFYKHFRYIQKNFYNLIDARGQYFLMEGSWHDGHWSTQLPNERWIFSPSITRAA